LTINVRLFSFSEACICFGFHLDFEDSCFLPNDGVYYVDAVLDDVIAVVDVVLLVDVIVFIELVLLVYLLRDNGNKTEH
jgi:hypothetical protein